jgi:uncharacterized membrane protein (GlpM family)
VIWDYALKFIIGGIIFVLMSYFSQSKMLFLSGVITFIPVMTLINMSMQIKTMSVVEFRAAEFNGIFGAFGAVVLMAAVFLLTGWIRPIYAALIAVAFYGSYMLLCHTYL